MKMLVMLLALAGLPAMAQTLVAARVLRAHSVLTAQDIAVVPGTVQGALSQIEAALGQELRVTVYPGRPIRAADLGPPALVERNQLVTLQFRQGRLGILAEGRALARGGAGDLIRVMNLQSRTTITGLVGPDGIVTVSP